MAVFLLFFLCILIFWCLFFSPYFSLFRCLFSVSLDLFPFFFFFFLDRTFSCTNCESGKRTMFLLKCKRTNVLQLACSVMELVVDDVFTNTLAAD